jgi:HK97 family phage major capsid protein
MTMHNTRAAFLGATALRGIQSVRAEGDDAAAIRALITQATSKIDAQQKAWDEFKKTNDENIAARTKDVVTTEKLDRVNSDIEKLGKDLDGINTVLAALKMNGGADPAGGPVRVSATPEEKAYRAAFSGKKGYLRRGAEAGLGDLAVKAALSSDSGADGGYTVSPELDNAISRVQQNVCAMRNLAQVINISAMTYRKLVSQGGASYGWVGERDTRPSTNTPTLSALEFPSKELYAMPAATQTLLDDSAVNIEQWLADEVGITFAEQEGAAFITGDGVNAPFGFLSYANVVDSSYAWGKLGYTASGNATGFAATNPGDAVISLCYSLKQSYRVNASWIMNRSVQSSVRQFKDGQGNYLWQPSLQAGAPSQLLGYPAETDDNMPDVGANTYPIAFGDFKRGYIVVDRIGTRVLRDPYTKSRTCCSTPPSASAAVCRISRRSSS